MKKKGVSLIIIILAILAILALIGGIIFVVSQNSSKQDETISETKDSNNTSNRTNTSTSKAPNSYSIGDKVTLKVDGVDEVFFVIKDSPESEDIVTLITKENIDTSTFKQSASANTIAFSEVKFWLLDGSKRKNEYNTPKELNIDIGSIVDTDNKYALYAVQEYGKKVGGIGRLLLKTEAEYLKKINSALLYANDGEFKSANNGLNYWLGTSTGYNYVYCVNGTVVINGVKGKVDWNGFDCSDFYGIRPVVEISKSKI